MKNRIIYLDHAAATPLDERVLDAMKPFLSEWFFNPSSPYLLAVQVRREYEQAKHAIAQAIGVKSDEIIMTAGATESINIMLESVAGHIVTTSIEHPAVLEAAKQIGATIVPVDEHGQVNPKDVASAISDETELVTVGLANSELGTVQQLRDIAEIIRGIKSQRRDSGNNRPLYFHTDASQGVGQIEVNAARLGVDAMTLNAGKLYGPKQTGLLWVDREVKLRPFIHGGGQERGIRSGTENVPAVIGFAKAIELATVHRKSESERLRNLRDALEKKLANAFPQAIFSGLKKRRLPGHLHISFPGLDAERLVFGLEAEGVCVATGSACAANKGTRSHVLTAIGLAPEVADGSIRITLGRMNNEENMVEAADIIIRIVQAEYERSGR